MVKSKGYNNRTRRLFKRHSRQRGIKSLRYLLEPIEVGEKVDILLNSSIQKGRPHRRYNGISGTVTQRQGQSYLVSLKTGGKTKTIIARPEHLRISKKQVE